VSRELFIFKGNEQSIHVLRRRPAPKRSVTPPPVAASR